MLNNTNGRYIFLYIYNIFWQTTSVIRILAGHNNLDIKLGNVSDFLIMLKLQLRFSVEKEYNMKHFKHEINLCWINVSIFRSFLIVCLNSFDTIYIYQRYVRWRKHDFLDYTFKFWGDERYDLQWSNSTTFTRCFDISVRMIRKNYVQFIHFYRVYFHWKYVEIRTSCIKCRL